MDVSFEENGYLTKFRAPDEIRSDTYVQNLHSFFFTTDIGIVQYSLLNKSFTPSVEPTDSTSFDTLQDSYEDPINIVRNIGFDDDEYEITDPPADPCTECGTYYWKGWNEQVFTMDAGDELGEDDSLEITWKGFNTIATLDA